MTCVEYLGYGYAIIRCGFSIHELDGKTYICIRDSVVKELLNAVFGLEKRFNAKSDSFAEWLRTQFRDFFVSGDVSYCAPLGVHLYEILLEWDRFIKEHNIKHFYAEIGDCDDFARMFTEFVVFRFKMNAVGRLWGMLYGKDGKEEVLGGHAYNWIMIPIDCDFDKVEVQVKGVEPQVSASMLPMQGGEMVLPLTNYTLVYRSYVAFG